MLMRSLGPFGEAKPPKPVEVVGDVELPLVLPWLREADHRQRE